MSFLIRCPHCGERSVYEFRFGGEVKQRPAVGSPDEVWLDYTYTKVNEWLQAVRNTVTNEVIETLIPG